MLFSLQSFTLKSRGVSEFEARFQRALVQRVRLSPLGAFWRTDVGVLNQVTVAWPYENMEQHERVREEAGAIDGWPPAVDELVVDHTETIYAAAPFSPPWIARKLGQVYEIRTYTYFVDQLPEVFSVWEELLPGRLEYSPLVAAGHAHQGETCLWVHIWAYKDVAERERVRRQTAAAGIWPVSVVDARLKCKPRAVTIRMENRLVVPADFSPLC